MKYKIGDEVLCIKEDDLDHFVGHTWKVVGFCKGLIYCENKELYKDYKHDIFKGVKGGFPFQEDEIVLASSLIKELL